MNNDYDKVIEFFSKHETAIDGAEKGSLLWCIKELDSMFDINIYIDNRDRMIKQQTLKVICTLINIYEKEDAEKRELNSEITTLINDLAAKELEVEYLKSKLSEETDEKMPEVRLIDANALIKDIAESIRLADEWEKEAREKEDKHGIKCAIDTRRSLLAMISRVKEAPTIEAEPVRRGRWETINPLYTNVYCSECGAAADKYLAKRYKGCPFCLCVMDATDMNVGSKRG